PAAGQGSLVLQIRADREEALRAVDPLVDGASLRELTAERTVVALLQATCASPIGVRAKQLGAPDERMRLEAFVGLPDGSEWIRDRVEGDSAEPTALGAELAKRLIDVGAREILNRAEHWTSRRA